MKIKEIMTKRVVFVNPETRAEEVARLLTKYRIHGVPVVSNKKVVGIITESDFFIKSSPDFCLLSYLDFLRKTEGKEKTSQKYKKEKSELLKARAKGMMNNKCITVRAEADIDELIKFFKIKYLFTFPVVDESNNIVGIITQADIIKLINKKVDN